MLKSSIDKPAYSKGGREKNKDTGRPRTDFKVDPTAPPKGTRSTYFSGISSTSYQSLKSQAQKERVSQHMKMRATPVLISDYVLGRDENTFIKISNFSKKIQFFNLQSPKTRYFYLAKEVLTKDYVLAPGMDVEIKLIFRAPQAGEPHIECHGTLLILVKGGDSISVDLLALPSIPRLEISKEVHFERTLIDKDLIKNVSSPESFASVKDSITAGWMNCKLLVKNRSKAPANFDISFGKNYPIRIMPMKGTVPGNSSCECIVEFLPVILGEQSYKCTLTYDSKSLEFFVNCNVIDTLVKMVALNGEDVSKLKILDFGNSYSGCKTKIPLRIENSNASSCSWTISSLGRGQVNVIQKTKNEDGQEFSSVPSKGIVGSNQDCVLDIEFYSHCQAMSKGFKSRSSKLEGKSHQVTMKFEYDDGHQKQSYDFEVKGNVTPFLVELSEHELVFPATNIKNSLSKTIYLINGNSNLGARFEFEKVAHFGISPLKGLILPSQKVEIEIMFNPNQYGEFKIRSICRFYWYNSNSSINHLLLPITEELSRTELLLCGSSAILAPIKTGKILKSADKHDGISPSQVEWSQKLSHHQKYNKYIRTKSRAAAALNRDEDAESGLSAPEPEFASCKGALALKSDSFLYQKQKMIFESLKGLYPAPSDSRPWEKSWEEAALSSEDLNEIYASTAVFDFGVVVNHTAAILPLNFFNGSSCPVLISIDNTRGAKRGPESSFITTDKKALRLHSLDISGCEIRFQANEVGNFFASIKYIINSSYSYEIQVKAQVVSVDLVSSTDSLALKYVAMGVQDESLTSNPSSSRGHIIQNVHGVDLKLPACTSSFQISNQTNATASFEISEVSSGNNEMVKSSSLDFGGYFIILPQNGEVPPHESVTINVTYVPGIAVNLQKSFLISVIDMNRKPVVVKKIPLNLVGSAEVCDLQLQTSSLKQGVLDLGMLPVMAEHESEDLFIMQTEYSKDNNGKFTLDGMKSFSLRNKGETPCSFVAFVTGLETGFHISPNYGIVQPGKNLDICVFANAADIGTYEGLVTVNVIGGERSFKIPVKYEGKFPNIEIVKLEPSFPAKVVIGSSANESFSIINKGQVLGRCIFDLSNFSDFHVKLYEEKVALGNSRKSAIGGDISGNFKKNKLGVVSSRNVYVLDIVPGDKLSLDVVFKPKVPGIYKDLSIPAFVLGAKSTWTFDIPVNTAAIHPPIKLGATEINFKDLILLSDATGKNSAMRQTFNIENVSADAIAWSLVISCGALNIFKPFYVDIEQGLLQPGDTQVIKVTFDPSKTGSYTGTMDIFIKIMNEDVALPVALKGNAVAPSLTFEPAELFLPLVPLRSPSRANFWIINNGCELSDVIPDIPPDILAQNIAFEVSFPQGRTLRENGGRLPCIVSYVAEEPISFSIEISFQDSDGGKYQIPIHGTSDYSVITLQNQILKGNLSTLPSTFPIFTTLSGFSLYSRADVSTMEAFWDSIYSTVTFWFKDHLGIVDSPIPSTSGPKILESFLALLTDFDTQNSSKPATSDSSKNEEPSTKRSTRYFKEVLYFLANKGALVASVKARFLLQFEDFKASLSSLDKKHNSNSSRSLYENYIANFELISKEAWCTLFLQIIRTFAIPAGPEATAARIANVTPERYLINWVSEICEEVGDVKKGFDVLGDIFVDCIPLAYLLTKYVPMIGAILQNFTYSPQNDEEASLNLSKIQAALGHTYGAKFHEEFNISKILRGNNLEQYLFLLFLHQSLPLFIAKDSIVFNAALQQSESKTIEIANNGSQSITYNAKISGDPEFVIDENVFTIPAKSRYNLKVSFKSRFVRRSSGILMVRSKKMGLYSCSALSFTLNGTVDPATPSQTFTIETMLYGSQENILRAKILNPFPFSANFKIKLEQKSMTKARASLPNINPPSFSIFRKILPIAANSSTELDVYFFPFETGTHECLLSFYDDSVGELLYKIEGKVLAPEPVEILNWTTPAGHALDRSIRIGTHNSLRAQALQAYLNLNFSSKAGLNFSAKSFKERNTLLSAEKKKYELPKKSLRYKLEYSNTAFAGPKELDLKYSNDANLYTDLPLVFTPKAPGKYCCRIVLSCLDCQDHRIYIINAISKPEEIPVELEFHSKANQALVQQLPITNNTNVDWMIRAMVNASNFSCPRSIAIKANSTGELPILFQPTQRGQSSGTLELRNITTKQNNSYKLLGVGLDADPEEIVQVEGLSREKKELTFKVANKLPEECEFKISTNMPVLKGSRSISIPGREYALYKLEILPLSAGKFIKFIKFTNQKDNTCTWYSVKVFNKLKQMEISPAKADFKLSLYSRPNQAVKSEIILVNHLEVELEYKVIVTPTSLVQGAEVVRISPKTNFKYEFTYQPVSEGKSSGTITFSNEEFGDLIYELELDANP